MPYCKHMSAVVVVLALMTTVPVLAGTTIFEDGFDSYDVGLPPPSPWNVMFGGISGLVSSAQAFNAPNSFRSESDGGWARWDYVTLTVPDLLSYHACIYLTASDRGGAVGFGFVEPGQANTGWWANAVYFGNDGQIYFNTRTAGSVVLGAWTMGKWYEVDVTIDYAAQVAIVHIDGVLANDNVPTDPKVLPASVYGTEVPLDQFGMFGQNFSGAGSSVIYYDDILVVDETPVPTKEITWGAIKAIYEAD